MLVWVGIIDVGVIYWGTGRKIQIGRGKRYLSIMNRTVLVIVRRKTVGIVKKTVFDVV